MRREIDEIPAATARVIRGDRDRHRSVAEAIRRRHPRTAVVVGRGTSDHAAVYARYLLEATLGIPTGLAAPSLVTVYGRTVDWRDVLVLAISQSGAGPDVVTVTETARAGGAITVAITNEPDSALAGVAEHMLSCRAGPEHAVAATKTYVTQLAAVASLVSFLTGDEDGESWAADLDRTPDALADVLAESERWLAGADALIESIIVDNRVLVVSRGYNLATALEVALKLKETSRLFAEGYSAADLLHGPVVLAGPRVPTIVFRPDGPMGTVIDEVRARLERAGARTWTIGGREVRGRYAGADRDGATAATRVLALPGDLPEVLTPLAFAIPGYLLAEAVARRGGANPDAPEGLTKVTLTR